MMTLHLLLSTLCVGLAALLAFGLRHGPARLRHGVWLCASAAFLLPLSVLVVVGTYLGA